MATRDFEFGQTTSSEAFNKRNPKFRDTVIIIGELSKKVFGGTCEYDSRVDEICFGLGRTCREEFIEIIFLASNGYPRPCYVIMRGLYERALTLEYIRRNPDKAERFFRYAAIQEHKVMVSHVAAVGEKSFDQQMAPEVSIATIKKSYKEIKKEFQITDCEKCSTTRVAASWDLDIGAMTHKVGEPYKGHYFFCYSLPNMYIHATYASGLKDAAANVWETPHQCELLVLEAARLLVAVFRSQDAQFRLCLKSEIDGIEKLINTRLVAIVRPS